MDSKELLEKAKQAYYNVQHKEYTKRSFIAGYLIGYAEQFRQYNVVRQSEQLVCPHCKGLEVYIDEYGGKPCKCTKQAN